MVDLTRNPTARECNELLRRGRRDALSICDCETGEHRTPYADEVARAYESACKFIHAEYERSIIQFGNEHEAAMNEARFAEEALKKLRQPYLPSTEIANDRYQDEYRNRHKRLALEGELETAAEEIRSAKSRAGLVRVDSIAEAVRLRDRAMHWLHPYCEGLFSVDPKLIEEIRPFDYGGMFFYDGLSQINRITDQYPSLFDKASSAKAIEFVEGNPRALSEAVSVANLRGIQESKETQYV